MLLNEKKRLQFSAYTLLTALGHGVEQNWNAIFNQQSGLSKCDFEDVNIETYIGRVQGVEEQSLPTDFSRFDGRNNRLAYQGAQLDQFAEHVSLAVERYGSSRVGIVLGTTTSGFLQAEHAYKALGEAEILPPDFPYAETAHPFATALFLQQYFQLQGPAITVGTACSSSAKAFVHADRWISAGLCDAVIVAGVDSLCANTLYGFHALGVLSEQACRPSDQHRDGLSLGEAAGFVLVEPSQGDGKVELLGYGESSDAFHMSSPHPQGKGVIHSMQQALNRAGLRALDVDYINLHGTASELNDRYENKAIYEIFSNHVPTSSTKGWTGHTLGSAGVIEAIISALCVEHGIKPTSLNTKVVDPEIKSHILLNHEEGAVNTVLSNSCGFGGSNCSLLIGKPKDRALRNTKKG